MFCFHTSRSRPLWFVTMARPRDFVMPLTGRCLLPRSSECSRAKAVAAIVHLGRRGQRVRPQQRPHDSETKAAASSPPVTSFRSRSQLERPTLLRRSLEMLRGEMAYPYTAFG